MTRRSLTMAGALLAIALTVPACSSGSQGDTAQPTFAADIRTSPRPVAEFYAPPTLTPVHPGVLVRADRLESSIDHARLWRVMFSSTSAVDQLEGSTSPTVETGLVLVPEASGPHPVAAWGHPTTGIASACAPSRQTQPDSGIAGAQQLIDEGWIVVAPDYEGLGIEGLGPHAYLIGDSLGHAMLDIARTVGSLPEAESSGELAVYGHSEGGQAALFAGQIARSYAPEFHLTAVAAMAPSGELDQIFREDHTTVTGGLLGAYLGGSWSRWFGSEDVSLPLDHGFSAESLFDHASWDLVGQIGEACSVGQPSVLPLWGRIQSALDAGTYWRRNPGVDAPWAARLAENSAGQQPIAAPVLLTVGTSDDIVSPAAVAATDARYRANGTSVTLRTVDGDHMSAVQAALRDVIAFLSSPHT